jgi:hypothetical protein
MLGEVFQRRSPWIIPNLLATTFYGERAYRPGFIVPTWVGLAGTFAVYCAAGVLFAVAGRERKGGWVLLLAGAATGLALNWFCFGIVLSGLNPLIRIYSPDRLITVSHLLYGIALATYPGFAKQLEMVAESVPETPVVPVPPPIPNSVAEERPGEESASAIASSEFASFDHASSDHASTDHTSSDHTSSDHTSSDHTSSDHTPSDHTPSDHTPSDHTSSDHTSSDHDIGGGIP